MIRKLIKGIILTCGVLFILIVGFGMLVGFSMFSDSDTQKDVAEAIVENGSKLTMGQRNCLTRAKTYIKGVGGFSKEGLKKQLQFDDFEDEDIDLALSQLDVDYKEQAAKKAKRYLNTIGLSRDELYEQLAFEEFSDEEIEYALEKVGY